MAEKAQERVQTAIKDFVNNVDKAHLRPMERTMHLCAADCCGDPKASIDEVHRCVERCQVGLLLLCFPCSRLIFEEIKPIVFKMFYS